MANTTKLLSTTLLALIVFRSAAFAFNLGPQTFLRTDLTIAIAMMVLNVAKDRVIASLTDRVVRYLAGASVVPVAFGIVFCSWDAVLALRLPQPMTYVARSIVWWLVAQAALRMDDASGRSTAGAAASLAILLVGAALGANLLSLPGLSPDYAWEISFVVAALPLLPSQRRLYALIVGLAAWSVLTVWVLNFSPEPLAGHLATTAYFAGLVTLPAWRRTQGDHRA